MINKNVHQILHEKKTEKWMKLEPRIYCQCKWVSIWYYKNIYILYEYINNTWIWQCVIFFPLLFIYFFFLMMMMTNIYIRFIIIIFFCLTTTTTTTTTRICCLHRILCWSVKFRNPYHCHCFFDYINWMYIYKKKVFFPPFP